MSRSRVLSNRVAYDCISQMCVQWCVDMCASVGDPSGIGGVEYGKAIVAGGSTQWPAWTTRIADWTAIGVDGDPPSVPVTGNAIVQAESVEGGLATSGLITLQDAMDIAKDEMDVMFAQYTAKIFPQRAGTYRKFCHWTRAKARREVYYQECVLKLKANCYTNRKRRRGVQLVSTRADVPGPMQFFQFSGHSAFRAPPGRPPLPESEWLRRYRARKRKARKTKRSRKDKRTPVNRAPDTKYGRPAHTLMLKRKSGSQTVRSVFNAEDTNEQPAALEESNPDVYNSQVNADE